MGVFGRKTRAVTRAQMLEAVPVRNPEARVEELDDGRTIVRIPVRPRWGVRWLVRQDPKRPMLRSFELDALGSEVWALCDGRRNVRDLIEQLAELKKLNLREAEVSVVAYLKTLTSRAVLFFPDPGSARE